MYLSHLADVWVLRIGLRKKSRLKISLNEIQAVLTKCQLATSSGEACAELSKLSTIIAENPSLLIPAHKMLRMTLCLNADKTIWCPQIEILLKQLESHCRTLVAAVRRGRTETELAAQRAATIADSMEANLTKQQPVLDAAQHRARTLQSQMVISVDGLKRMRQLEIRYNAEADAIQQKLNSVGWSAESTAQIEVGSLCDEAPHGQQSPNHSANHSLAEAVSKSKSDFASANKRCKRDNAGGYTALQTHCGPACEMVEEAMMKDHDLGRERVLTEVAAEQRGHIALARCIQSGWGGMAADPAEAFQMFMAFQRVEELARTAQCCLGECYEYGLGVQADPMKAFGWYKKSAQAGFARAQCAVGACYRDGIGTKESVVKACKWFATSSKQDYARAHVCLGLMHLQAEQDLSSFQCFFKAAELGHIYA